MSRPLAYLAGPYRAATPYGIHQNVEDARRVAAELWRMGFSVHCPHTNTHGLGGVIPEKEFLEGDLVVLRRCDLVVVEGNYDTSEGTLEEIFAAQEHEIPRYYWPGCVGRLMADWGEAIGEQPSTPE
jgi:hypothetical protein